MKLRDLKFLLINYVILWITSFCWKERIPGWPSPCESRRWTSVSISFFTSSYKSLRALSHWVSICSIKIPRVKHSSVRCRWWIDWCKWTVKNVSRCTKHVPCIRSQALVAAQHTTRTWTNCRLTGNVGKFPLQTDSTSWNALESFMRFTQSCNSCICEASSWKVAWLSLNFCLENSSIRISWALFQFFHLVHTSHMSLSECSFPLRQFFVKSGLLSSRDVFISLVRMVNVQTTGMNLSLKLSRVETVEKICSAFLLQYFRPCLCESVISLLFKKLISCHLPLQRVWVVLHFLLELLDVSREYRLCRSEILDSTLFCVRTQLQDSPRLLGNEMNLTQSFSQGVINLWSVCICFSLLWVPWWSQHVPYLLIVQIRFKRGSSNALSRIISRRHARSVDEYRCTSCIVHLSEIVGLTTCKSIRFSQLAKRRSVSWIVAVVISMWKEK